MPCPNPCHDKRYNDHLPGSGSSWDVASAKNSGKDFTVSGMEKRQ